ncbi:MAG: phosphatidylinositol mannoside acyltransferase [Actinomycetota bacterium]|nr:phosphatidylinositol mannoside acyltransferase [Actinomycetota bacterium]
MAHKERFIDDIPGYLKYYGFRAGGWMVGKLPEKASFGLSVAVAEIAYLISREKRETVYENMRLVKPEAGHKEWRSLARRSFHAYTRYWVNLLRCYYTPFEEIYYTMTVPHGTYWFDEALKKKCGVVLALPHYGSWDIIGGWVGHNYPSFWAVAEQLKPRPMYKFHTELRRRMGIRIIPLGEGTVNEVIRVLADNGMVCLLSDRLIAGSGVEVVFFGQKIEMPIGPALLAVKMGTVVLPCQIIRRDGLYHGNVGPPLEVEVSGDTRRDVKVNTQKLARIFEDFIREDPTQWHMFQPIFSRDKE